MGESLNENPKNSPQNQRIFDENKVFFECFNIGGNEEKENIDIAKKICAYLDKRMPKKDSYAKQIRFVKDRAGHDRRYASKILANSKRRSGGSQSTALNQA